MRMGEAGIAATVGDISQVLADTKRDEQLRYWAAMALGQLEDDRAVPFLIQALTDNSATVRAGSAMALGFIGSVSATDSLCATAVSDDNMAPRRSAVTALYFLVNAESTKCLVRVAADEHELQEVRIASLSLLSEQLLERRGFEALIPALDDPDADIKGLSAIILSSEYANEPALLESLSVTQSLVEAILGASSHSWVYVRMVERLEDVAAREFVLDGEDDHLYYEPVRTAINLRIEQWAGEELK